MKTKMLILGFSFLVAMGLSSCYTQFAATGDGYYNSDSQAYYDSSSSGYAYDSTGAPIINDYNYYGYEYPSYYGFYDNWWTPSPWWWRSDLWLGWDSYAYGGPSWYAGIGWGYPYGGYYSSNYYSQFYPYGSAHANRYGQFAGRPRTIGETRGRESYGGGSTNPYTQPGVSNTSNGGSLGTGPSASPSSSVTRSSSATSPSTGSGSNATSNQPRTRSTDSSPQSQPPAQEQPRVRDNGNSPNTQGNQGRPRGGTTSSYRTSSGPQRVRYSRGQQTPVRSSSPSRVVSGAPTGRTASRTSCVQYASQQYELASFLSSPFEERRVEFGRRKVQAIVWTTGRDTDALSVDCKLV